MRTQQGPRSIQACQHPPWRAGSQLCWCLGTSGGWHGPGGLFPAGTRWGDTHTSVSRGTRPHACSEARLRAAAGAADVPPHPFHLRSRRWRGLSAEAVPVGRRCLRGRSRPSPGCLGSARRRAARPPASPRCHTGGAYGQPAALLEPGPGPCGGAGAGPLCWSQRNRLQLLAAAAERQRRRRQQRGGGMTLKSGRSASAGSMRTALSDLYLEHLLQNRAKPEVSGGPGAATPDGPDPPPRRPRLPPPRENAPLTPRSPSPPRPGRDPRGAPPPSHVPCAPASPRALRPAPRARHRAPGGPPPSRPSRTRSGERGPQGRDPTAGRRWASRCVPCMWHCWSPTPQERGSSLGDVGRLGEMVSQRGRAGKEELGGGEEGFSILPRRSLCLFCCKVVAGLNWNCLSHELIQLLRNLQVHSMGWRGGGGGGSRPQRCNQPFLHLPQGWEGAGGVCAPHLQQKESRLHQPCPLCWEGSFPSQCHLG